MDREKRQQRSISSHFETREAESGELFICGYFAVFHSKCQLWEDCTESIDEHAFDETLSEDIRCLIDHDTRLVLGRTKSGTLTLKTDTRGLWAEVKINPEDTDAMNLYSRVKRGDVDQCSFGFMILDEEMQYDEKTDAIHWIIKKVKLYEVSVCTFPAYEDTSVVARKKDYETIRKRKAEAWKTKMKNRLKGE